MGSVGNAPLLAPAGKNRRPGAASSRSRGNRSPSTYSPLAGRYSRPDSPGRHFPRASPGDPVLPLYALPKGRRSGGPPAVPRRSPPAVPCRARFTSRGSAVPRFRCRAPSEPRGGPRCVDLRAAVAGLKGPTGRSARRSQGPGKAKGPGAETPGPAAVPDGYDSD